MSFTERQAIGPSKAILLDARNIRGVEDTGATPMRHMVIITAAREG